MMYTIHTENERPPIPTRACDWSAWVEGWEECGLQAHGETESEALANLASWVECRMDYSDHMEPMLEAVRQRLFPEEVR